MTTPAAAPAAPAAAATPAAAPATPAAAAAPAAAADTSLIPAAPAAAAPAATPAATPAPAAAAAPVDPNSPDAWVLSEGVLGQGKRPDWFKADKYASVAAQAEAYTALEQRFGSFTGAPKEGKYDSKLPDGAGVELTGDHPLLDSFGKWAKDNQLSQKGYTELLGMLGQYEAQHFVDADAVKAELGKDADTRLTAIAQWGAANLDKAGYESLRTALTPGKDTATFVQLIESVIAKTTQTPLPKPGNDTPSANSANAAQAEIDRMMKEKLPNGKDRYFEDAKFRKEVEEKRTKLFANAA